MRQAIKRWLDDNEQVVDYGELYKALIKQVDEAAAEYFLIETGRNMSQTAEALGVHRSSLMYKAKNFGITFDRNKGGYIQDATTNQLR